MTISLNLYSMAAEAVGILFSEGDPFGGAVDRDMLTTEIYEATKRKYAEVGETDLTELEFKECIELSKIKPNERNEILRGSAEPAAGLHPHGQA